MVGLVGLVGLEIVIDFVGNSFDFSPLYERKKKHSESIQGVFVPSKSPSPRELISSDYSSAGCTIQVICIQVRLPPGTEGRKDSYRTY